MEILIYIVLLVGVVIGFIQGAFKQIANFVGTIAGLILAAICYEKIGDALSDTTGTSVGIGHTVAFVLIAIIAPVLLGWIASLLTKLFSVVHLGFLNRLAGAVIGAVCNMLIMSLAFNAYDFGVSKAGFHPEKLSQRPDLYYTVKHAAQFIIPDAIIVTDATEVVNGAEPKYGLRPIVNEAVEKVNPF